MTLQWTDSYPTTESPVVVGATSIATNPGRTPHSELDRYMLRVLTTINNTQTPLNAVIYSDHCWRISIQPRTQQWSFVSIVVTLVGDQYSVCIERPEGGKAYRCASIEDLRKIVPEEESAFLAHWKVNGQDSSGKLHGKSA